jgi:hypothetical protein
MHVVEEEIAAKREQAIVDPAVFLGCVPPEMLMGVDSPHAENSLSLRKPGLPQK